MEHIYEPDSMGLDDILGRVEFPPGAVGQHTRVLLQS